MAGGVPPIACHLPPPRQPARPLETGAGRAYATPVVPAASCRRFAAASTPVDPSHHFTPGDALRAFSCDSLYRVTTTPTGHGFSDALPAPGDRALAPAGRIWHDVLDHALQQPPLSYPLRTARPSLMCVRSGARSPLLCSPLPPWMPSASSRASRPCPYHTTPCLPAASFPKKRVDTEIVFPVVCPQSETRGNITDTP